PHVRARAKKGRRPDGVRVPQARAHRLVVLEDSWLLRDRDASSVNFFENGIATTAQESFANFATEVFGVFSGAGFAKNFRAVRMRHNRIEMNSAANYFSGRADWDLAASTQLVQKCAFAGSRCTSIRVIKKCQVLPRPFVAFSNLNSQRSLPRGWTHNLR